MTPRTALEKQCLDCVYEDVRADGSRLCLLPSPSKAKGKDGAGHCLDMKPAPTPEEMAQHAWYQELAARYPKLKEVCNG